MADRTIRNEETIEVIELPEEIKEFLAKKEKEILERAPQIDIGRIVIGYATKKDVTDFSELKAVQDYTPELERRVPDELQGESTVYGYIFDSNLPNSYDDLIASGQIRGFQELIAMEFIKIVEIKEEVTHHRIYVRVIDKNKAESLGVTHNLDAESLFNYGGNELGSNIGYRTKVTGVILVGGGHYAIFCDFTTDDFGRGVVELSPVGGYYGHEVRFSITEGGTNWDNKPYSKPEKFILETGRDLYVTITADTGEGKIVEITSPVNGGEYENIEPIKFRGEVKGRITGRLSTKITLILPDGKVMSIYEGNKEKIEKDIYIPMPGVYKAIIGVADEAPTRPIVKEVLFSVKKAELPELPPEEKKKFEALYNMDNYFLEMFRQFEKMLEGAENAGVFAKKQEVSKVASAVKQMMKNIDIFKRAIKDIENDKKRYLEEKDDILKPLVSKYRKRFMFDQNIEDLLIKRKDAVTSLDNSIKILNKKVDDLERNIKKLVGLGYKKVNRAKPESVMADAENFARKVMANLVLISGKAEPGHKLTDSLSEKTKQYLEVEYVPDAPRGSLYEVYDDLRIVMHLTDELIKSLQNVVNK